MSTPNTSPVFTKTPNMSWCQLTTANTAMDGTGTVGTVFTAGASGSRVSGIRVKFMGATVATVIRVWVNNGSSTTVAANNSLLSEQQLGATSASNSTAQPDIEIPLDEWLPGGYKLTVAIGTTVTGPLALTAHQSGDY